MENAWWYAVPSGKDGPITEAELRALLVKGAINLRSLVWKEGMAAWAELGAVQELNALTKSVPPELPNTEERTPPVLPHIPKSDAQLYAVAGRWRRFLARLADLYVLSLVLGTAAGIAAVFVAPGFLTWIDKPGSGLLFGWALLPVVLCVEAVIFAVAGTTIGKGLLGVRVLTSDGGQPTFTQYLSRQVGVYFSGLGTGFPLVSLVTTVSQSRRLGAGKSTSYDEGRFIVVGRKLGFVRIVLAAVALVAVFVVYVMLVTIGNAPAKRASAVDAPQAAATTWTNQVTHALAEVPGGWQHTTQTNADGQTVDVFSHAALDVVLVLGNEDMGERPLDRYAVEWTAAVKGTMTIQEAPGNVSAGQLAWHGVGTMNEDPKYRTDAVDALLVVRGRKVWRVVAIGTPAGIGDAEVERMRQRLIGTL